MNVDIGKCYMIYYLIFSGLPDTDFIKEMIPEVDIDKFRQGLIGKYSVIKSKLLLIS